MRHLFSLVEPPPVSAGGYKGAGLKHRLPAVIFMLLSLATPVLSSAEVSLAFIPMEESKYLVKGQGFAGISAVNLTVDYDTTYLFFPQVDVMGGELQEKDRGAATSPGNLQLHILRQDPDGPFEATIYFQKRGPYDAIINFVTAEVADLSGTYRPVPVEMVKPSPSMNEPDPVQAAPGQETAISSIPPESAEDAQGIPASAAPAAQEDRNPKASGDGKRKPVALRFRDYTGKKSLSAFEALFSHADPCCRQSPPVVIADGTRFAEVVITRMHIGTRAPNCTVRGAQLVSAHPGARQEWVVVVRPDEDQWNGTINCSTTHGSVEIPLTATPAIEIPFHTLAGVTEKTFLTRLRSFIDERTGKGKTEPPVWLLEYQFTANYLAALEEPAVKLSLQKKGMPK